MSLQKSTGRPRGSDETVEIPRAADASYRLLFEKHPIPMWIYDLESLRFLAVNEAAIQRYGYSCAEFLRMTIRDICPAKNISALQDDVAQLNMALEKTGRWRHRRRDGALFDVEIISHDLDWAGRRARVVFAMDVSERRQAE